MSNILEMPNKDEGKARLEARSNAERRLHAEKRREARLNEKLSQLLQPPKGRKRVPIAKAIRETFANNLGGLALTDCTRPTAIDRLRIAFRNERFFTSETFDSRWSKRMRWVRFKDDGDRGAREAIASNPEDFVKMAKAIAQAASISESTALYKLLENTPYDPDPEKLRNSDHRSEASLSEAIHRLRSDVMKASPELNWYFRTIIEQRITAPQLRDTGFIFSPGTGRFDSGQTGGYELDPISIMDGEGRDGGEDYPNFGPQITLGKLTMMACPASFLLSLEEQASIVGKDGALLPYPSDAIESILAARDSTSVTERQSVRDVSGSYEEIWKVDLMLLPIGRAERFSIEPMLYFKNESEDFSVYNFDTTERVGEPLVCAGARIERRRHKPETAPSLGDADYHFRLFDLRRWKGWKHQEIDALQDEIIFNVSSAGGRRWLLQHLSERERVDQPSLIVEPVYSFAPEFAVPAAYTSVPAASVGGLIVRNIAFAEDGETIIDKLIADAQRRIAALRTAIDEWETDYAAARDVRLRIDDETKPS